VDDEHRDGENAADETMASTPSSSARAPRPLRQVRQDLLPTRRGDTSVTKVSTHWACLALGLVVALAGCGQGSQAQSGGTPVPFKVGTFERDGGRAFVGLVLRDTQVVDIAQAKPPSRRATLRHRSWRGPAT